MILRMNTGHLCNAREYELLNLCTAVLCMKTNFQGTGDGNVLD